MKAPRRPRQTRLLPRVCLCGVGLLAAALIFHLNDVTGSHRPTVDRDIVLSKRELIQQKEDNQTDSISRSAINEFPEDIFTLEQRRQGAVLLHVLCAIYMFHALAIVCDVYFVPSLEKVSENLQLSQDVAGATFMAAGSSAPELFTSLIGVFITKGDVGVGTIVGSAVFNILVIIGICGIFSGQPITLSWWPVFRDAVFYILSILVLILVIYDEKVLWWETIILISMYGIYIIIMKFNRSLCSLVERHCSRAGQPCLSSLRRTTAVGNVGDCDNDMVPLKPDSSVVAGQDSGVVMVDELLHLHPHQLSFSEASLRLLITPHFPPFTRLRMAGRMVINERQRLIRARVGPEEGGASGEEGLGASGSWGRENGTVAEGDRQMLEGETERGKEMGGETGGGAQPKEDEEEEEEQEEGEENTPFKPFILPDGWCVRLKWLLSWPVSVLLHCTIPDCNLPRWERWYLLTFLSSTLWIALFSYLMVWMVTIISYTLGIPEVIMGITFLAAGTSVPDCMASLIVARQGMGDMAVSNTIGSNIFDVLLGLGFPWALRTLIVSYGSVVTINSKGLVYSVILLLASVALTVLCVHLNRWRLDRRLGLSLMLLYAIFLLCSVGFERL
ncbi:sodium/potassium/calcium exchanger 3-like isoform X2 [Seriola lalandi dorsalis]|uniref:sodium/potassium/calcium exchanger 3-like isoform X2 n=1 Tax=Seriola lalandi dorsalis TaxID=1841481 RepID=UPI000C6F8249|nr:sodium/potassium/calcium exchanger 3-like isoform X2 [Seriola lalandi dorsalis]XP_056239005.1 sodium/potassium/calcium exchanger 3 isoform X2 [Seriola aureovittata]